MVQSYIRCNFEFYKPHHEAIDGQTEHFPVMVLMAEAING